MNRPAPSQADPEALREFSARLSAAQAQDANLGAARIEKVLRHVPGKRAIAQGLYQGKPAVFRFYLEAAADRAAREWAEVTRIWPMMMSGDLRVAEPYHFNAEHAIMLTEAVPGTPLLEHLYHLPPEARAGHMQGPAAWLRKYTTSTETMHPPRAARWLARAEDQSARQPHPRLKRTEEHIIRYLRTLVDAASSQDWRHAICHGDFHPNNLILGNRHLTGIDLGGSARLPVCKDIARFLMHMGRRGMRPSGAARFGVDSEGFDAFCTAFDLGAWEREIALPFMLGIEALIRVETPDMPASRIRRAEAMYDLLLDDLARIQRPF